MPDPNPPRSSAVHSWVPPTFAVLSVGLALGSLWLGYGPIGGDPDRLYRPIKTLLAESLRAGSLPFWSDRLGLGVPLVAESHVAAFYPPNWVAYRLMGVDLAYRMLMWGHHVFLAIATFLYARRSGLSSWGSALAAVSFTLCGFLAIHCSHEPFYHALPYLCLALWASESYLQTGKLRWLAFLALIIGGQLLVGHFQIQFWTMGLAITSGLWRVVFSRVPVRRFALVVFALIWGGVIAAIQLGPTWELARFVGQTDRSPSELSAYGFPPAHLVELVAPRFFRALKGGPEDIYWEIRRTTGYEAFFYVGSIPLALAFAGALARDRRRLGPWFVLVPVSIGLATMPYWWPAGYDRVTRLPGFGFFRAPARYTMIASLGLCLLAGRGLDRSIDRIRFRSGLVVATSLAFGLLAAAWVRAGRPEFRGSIGDDSLISRLAQGGLAWFVGLAVIGLWRIARLGPWLPVAVTAIELGILFHVASPDWGWEAPLPEASPVLERLTSTEGVGLVGGQLDNLPIRAGLTTAPAYLGFRLPPPNPLLKLLQDRGVNAPPSPEGLRWMRRFGVTHGVWYAPVRLAEGEATEAMPDPTLDLLAYIRQPHPDHMTWRVVSLAPPLPKARIATKVRTAFDELRVLEGKTASTDEMEAWYVAGREPSKPLGPVATRASVLEWDGRTGRVEHDGWCDLILARTYAPGWLARIDDGPELPATPVDGGLQAIRIDGRGITRVSVRYRPPGLIGSSVASLLGISSAIAVLIWPRRKGLA